MNKQEIAYTAKMTYEAPVVEITEVIIEKGFHASLCAGVNYDEDESTY